MKQLFGLVVVLPLCLAAQSYATINAWTCNGVTDDRAVLHKDALSAALLSSPVLAAAARSNTVVAFPTPEGKCKDFRMFLSPVMPANLAQ